MARRKGNQPRSGKLSGNRRGDLVARRMERDLASEPGGLPVSLDYQTGAAPTVDRSFSGADYGGPGRGRVKHSKARAIRRAGHVEERKLALGGDDSDIRRRTRG